MIVAGTFFYEQAVDVIVIYIITPQTKSCDYDLCILRSMSGYDDKNVVFYEVAFFVRACRQIIRVIIYTYRG